MPSYVHVLIFTLLPDVCSLYREQHFTALLASARSEFGEVRVVESYLLGQAAQVAERAEATQSRGESSVYFHHVSARERAVVLAVSSCFCNYHSNSHLCIKRLCGR